jgi:hypothetical protein
MRSHLMPCVGIIHGGPALLIGKRLRECFVHGALVLGHAHPVKLRGQELLIYLLLPGHVIGGLAAATHFYFIKNTLFYF